MSISQFPLVVSLLGLLYMWYVVRRDRVPKNLPFEGWYYKHSLLGGADHFFPDGLAWYMRKASDTEVHIDTGPKMLNPMRMPWHAARKLFGRKDGLVP